MQRDLRTVLVVYKKSDLQIYVKEHHDPRISALVEEKDALVARMLRSHQENEEALGAIKAFLQQRKIRSRWTYRSKAPSFQGIDLVISIGGDGTLLEAARHIQDKTPLVGVNSSPSSSVGHLCATDLRGFAETFERFQDEALPENPLTRIQVFKNGEALRPWALNDILFAHECPAATSRYHLGFGTTEEEQRSSGIWIATASGSTAAILSAGGEVMPLHDRRLQFRARELYTKPPRAFEDRLSSGGSESPARLRPTASGWLEEGEPLELQCLTRQATLFFDGPWNRHVVHYGERLRFQQAPSPLRLLGDLQRRYSAPLAPKRD